jgi:hypothetical protein
MAGDISPTLIIGHDQQDVRVLRHRRLCANNWSEQKGAESENQQLQSAEDKRVIGSMSS